MLALKEWDWQKGILNAAPCCNSIRPETPDPLGSNQDLRARPNEITAKEIFHGPEMDQIRQSMLRGERPEACTTCWRMEDRNPEDPWSYRLLSKPTWLKPDDMSYIEKPELAVIDFAFGENCNLRCRMCKPGLSNKLKLDYKYFIENEVDTSGIEGFDYRAQWPDKPVTEVVRKEGLTLSDFEHRVYNWASDSPQWQDILDNIDTIKAIKATGGETLLTEGFIQFIDTAIERGVASDMHLEFHTNATKFTTKNIEKLNQFRVLHFNLSIDSIGENYEYIRYPMPWKKLTASLRNMLSKIERDRLKNFSFNPVISALNAHYLIDLAVYQRELAVEYDLYHASFYVDLLWPDRKYTNVKFLPPQIKQDLLDLYRPYNGRDKLQNRMLGPIIHHIEENLDYQPTEQDRLNMLREITVFDKSRNQCYNDYLHSDVIEFLETPL